MGVYNWPFNKLAFLYISEDAKGTLSLMPEFKVRERTLLESLHRFGVTEEGCVQAWFSFPHSMRIFYVHAYSSKIWNEAVSYRLATYGPRVVEGDLVCLDEDSDDEHFPNSKVSIISSKFSKNSYHSINTNFQKPLCEKQFKTKHGYYFFFNPCFYSAVGHGLYTFDKWKNKIVSGMNERYKDCKPFFKEYIL